MSEQVYEITSRTATRKEIGQMDPWVQWAYTHGEPVILHSNDGYMTAPIVITLPPRRFRALLCKEPGKMFWATVKEED